MALTQILGHPAAQHALKLQPGEHEKYMEQYQSMKLGR